MQFRKAAAFLGEAEVELGAIHRAVSPSCALRFPGWRVAFGTVDVQAN